MCVCVPSESTVKLVSWCTLLGLESGNDGHSYPSNDGLCREMWEKGGLEFSLLRATGPHPLHSLCCAKETGKKARLWLQSPCEILYICPSLRWPKGWLFPSLLFPAPCLPEAIPNWLVGKILALET